jgi:hypothetical protein
MTTDERAAMLLRALVKCRPLTSDESLSIDQLAYKLIIDGDYARRYWCLGLSGRGRSYRIHRF